jgi:hypothetical protein
MWPPNLPNHRCARMFVHTFCTNPSLWRNFVQSGKVPLYSRGIVSRMASRVQTAPTSFWNSLVIWYKVLGFTTLLLRCMDLWATRKCNSQKIRFQDADFVPTKPLYWHQILTIFTSYVPYSIFQKILLSNEKFWKKLTATRVQSWRFTKNLNVKFPFLPYQPTHNSHRGA